jgi:hypothetical protein
MMGTSANQAHEPHMPNGMDLPPSPGDRGAAAFGQAGADDEAAKHRQPRQVFLFSGHMIDTPARATPRFPPAKEGEAARRIAAALDRFGAGPEDLAFTQGACGGDLLFSEACLQRGVKLHWLQPHREADFTRKSVLRCGSEWLQRYRAARAGLAGPVRTAPDELGELPPGAAPGAAYERGNLWLLATALAYGADKLRFICLWNGGEDDGPGGTAHMYEEVKRRAGQITWIDSRDL